MLRFGCCIPGVSFMPQVSDVEKSALDILTEGFELVKNVGFDVAEATVGTVMALTDDELRSAHERGVVLEACNSFVPASLALYCTSPDALREFCHTSMCKMSSLGCKTVVLGSGGARRLPDDFAQDRGEPLKRFLRICSEVGAQYGITTVLEPLNYKETNCVNKVSEGYAVVKELSLPYVRLLADSYHMFHECEPYETLHECEDMLCHVHISETDRSVPTGECSEYLRGFARALKNTTAYSGTVSVECKFDLSDFPRECAAALDALKTIFA